MGTPTAKAKTISLADYGIFTEEVYYQLPPGELHRRTLDAGMGREADSGALAVNTGTFTGRSPEDRFIVRDAITEDQVWWGPVNKPFDPEKFDLLYDKVIEYLND